MHATVMSEVDANAQFTLPLFELQLYHACDRMAREGADLGWAITHWTMIPGFAGRYLTSRRELAEAEQHILALVRAAWERQGQPADPQRVVEDCRPWLYAFVAEGIARWRRLPPQHHWFGCFCATQEPDPRLAALHFYNCVCPESPFADGEALQDDLRQCLLALRRAAPAVERLQCGSWVNNLPPIQALFPPSYRHSLVQTDPDGKSGLGWWGQFVSSAGGLHQRRAAELRLTGNFHYARLLGRCSLADALQHLGAG